MSKATKPVRLRSEVPTTPGAIHLSDIELPPGGETIEALLRDDTDAGPEQKSRLRDLLFPFLKEDV